MRSMIHSKPPTMFRYVEIFTFLFCLASFVGTDLPASVEDNSINRTIRNLVASKTESRSITYSQPQLKASHERRYTIISCRIDRPRPNISVFFSCPAMRRQSFSSSDNGRRPTTGFCYQGCRPTHNCTNHDLATGQLCVPDQRTLFCEMTKSDNSITVKVKIDRTDPKMAGMWSCSHTGIESTEFEIITDNVKVIPKQQKEETTFPTKIELENTGSTHTTSSGGSFWENNSLDTLRKPYMIITILIIFGVSILVNLVFCIQCILVKSYNDAFERDANNVNCLAACLCLPRELRKEDTFRFSSSASNTYINQDRYPIAANTNNYASAPTVFHPVYNQSPLGYQDNFVRPSPSLVGTLPRKSQQHTNIQYPIDSSPLLGTMLYQAPTENDLAFSPNTIPSYVRTPSLSAPSPTASQRLLTENQSNFPTPKMSRTQPFGQYPDANYAMPNLDWARMNGQYLHGIYDEVAPNTLVVPSLDESRPIDSLPLQNQNLASRQSGSFSQNATLKRSNVSRDGIKLQYKQSHFSDDSSADGQLGTQPQTIPINTQLNLASHSNNG